MDCRETQAQLELYVLGGLSPQVGDAVRGHLSSCPDCREAEAECRFLVCRIAGTSAPNRPRPAFVASLHEAVAGEIRSQRRHLALRRAMTGAVAVAAMLVLAWGAWQLVPKGPAGSERVGDLPRREAGDRWRLDGASAQPASAADGVIVRGDSLYFLSRAEAGPAVAAVDLAGGQLRWRGPAGSAGYLAADDSRVYCLAPAGGRAFALVALDAADGRQLWRFAERAVDLLASPCPPVPVHGGRVAWSTSEAVHMLDAATGEPIWRYQTGPAGPSPAVAVAGVWLYLAGQTSFSCLDVRTGQLEWQLDTAGGGAGRRRPLLALGGGKAYVVSGAAGTDELWSLDLTTHRVRWRVPVEPARHLLAEGGLFLRGEDVRAYSGRTGRLLWRRAVSGCGAMTAQNGLLYAVDSRGTGRLLALDPASGREAWAMGGLRSCDAFRLVGTSGYVKTSDGVIHAFAMGTR